MKKFTLFISVFICFFFFYNQGFGRSWSDLDRGEHKYYGSEKDEKYTINNFLVEKEDWENHYSFSFLGFYKYIDYPKYKSYRVLPFYYGLSSKIDNRKMTVLPLCFSYFETDRDAKISYILYPLYYSSVTKRKTDRSLLLLSWWGSESRSGMKYSYQTFFPFFYHSNEKFLKSEIEESLFISPLLNWWSKSKKNDANETIWWFPIIPLTYHNTGVKGGHRNILWLIDYKWKRIDNEDYMQRFWILPLVTWKKGSDGYTSLIFPLYFNNRYSNGDYYTNILPFYVAWRDSTYKKIKKTTLTPLYGSSTVMDYKEEKKLSSSFWFPLIPLFYRSKNIVGRTHTNLLWLLDWASDRNGDVERFLLMPFIFYQSGDGGYRYFPPFYFRPQSANKEEGYSYGLFHYSSWSKSRKVTWSWPYYHSENYSKGLKNDSDAVPKIEEYYTHFLPFYWSWQSNNSKGRIIFPLIFNYRDKNTNIHVNLTGYARKTYLGPLNPDFTLAMEKDDQGWILDTDVSWLYDVVSFSGRVLVKNPFDSSFEKNKGENVVQSVGSEPISDKNIQTDKEFSRENSKYFWGWKLLFGWMAYEHADSKRHFRLLPLSWFTWDKESDNKRYVFLPFFLSYKSSQQEYFVIAPFYASQKEGESYARGFLVNLYWDEYEAKNDYREQTVLWPIFNWYSSPEKSGLRIFPFFWHRTWRDDSIETSQTFAPFYYSRHSVDNDTGDILYNKKINPFYLFEYKKTSKGEFSTLKIPLLPIFYRSTSNNYSHWNFMGFIDSVTNREYNRFFIFPFYYGSEYNGTVYRNILGILDWKFDDEVLKKSMFFPFYNWERDEGIKFILFPLLTYIKNSEEEKFRFVAGAYWYSSSIYERQNFFYLFDHIKYKLFRGERNIYSGLFSSVKYTVSPEVREMQLLWGSLLDCKNYKKSNDYSIDALLWLASIKRERGSFHHRIMPLYSYYSKEDSWSLLLPPLLSYFSEDEAGDFDLGVLGFLYYRNNDRISGRDRRMWLLGSIYNEVKKPERGYHAMGSLWGILWNYETEKETNFKKFTILEGLYQWKEKDGIGEHSVLWFF